MKKREREKKESKAGKFVTSQDFQIKRPQRDPLLRVTRHRGQR
jgi:hypothetical protein